jgi:hypothetical protein
MDNIQQQNVRNADGRVQQLLTTIKSQLGELCLKNKINLDRWRFVEGEFVEGEILNNTVTLHIVFEKGGHNG